MATCEIACQTEKVIIAYYDQESQKKYRVKRKDANGGKYYTKKQNEYMKTYREKQKLKKKDQNALAIEVKA